MAFMGFRWLSHTVMPAAGDNDAMGAAPAAHHDNPALGIFFIVLGMSCISVNDMLIKLLSGDYPLHQMIFVRSAIGICFSLVIVQFEGGFGILRTDQPFLHLLRALLVVVANMAYFAGLAVIPLAEAMALYFVAPLFITLLSIPILGERVGSRRLAAVLLGFVGVLVMIEPWNSAGMTVATRLVLLLPVVSALTYALMQILTRRLGVNSKASAMAVYIQGAFIVVSAAFFAIAGDGRYTDTGDHASVQFLLRAWRWPADGDLYVFLGLGAMSAIIGYSISQAYRSAPAATIAPFEYVSMPLAVLWGWLFWRELPGGASWAGIALIVGAGLYVFLREGKRRRPVAARRPIRRY
jgi:S-adenosylmethionine uptake transporter